VLAVCCGKTPRDDLARCNDGFSAGAGQGLQQQQQMCQQHLHLQQMCQLAMGLFCIRRNGDSRSGTLPRLFLHFCNACNLQETWTFFQVLGDGWAFCRFSQCTEHRDSTNAQSNCLLEQPCLIVLDNKYIFNIY